MQTMRLLLARVGVRTPFARDALLATLLAAAAVGVSLVNAGRTDLVGPLPGPPAGTVALVAAAVAGGAAALAWRRRAPAAVLAVTVAGHLVERALAADQNAGWPSVWVALYSLGAYANRRYAMAGWLLASFAYAAVWSGVTGAANTSVTLGILTLLGAYVQTRRAYQAELVARAERRERDREERAARAIVDERGRIARELHDVVAHHLSGMVVQAGAAERLLDRHPEQVRAILTDIRVSGKDTLASMRRLIGVLRDDADGTAPQPGLDQLDAVAERARAAGVAVEVTVEGEQRPLPDEVNLAACRILQEALTNVRKHAPGATARALVRYLPDKIEIRVLDHGPDPASAPGPAEPEPSGGVGLVGMRERAAVLGGDFDAGPRGGEGGWVVQAHLPVGRPGRGEP